MLAPEVRVSAGKFAELAAALVNGDGTPRIREQVIASVRAALEGVATEARRLGALDARASVLREALAIATGEQQAAAARVATIQRELDELEARRALTK